MTDEIKPNRLTKARPDLVTAILGVVDDVDAGGSLWFQQAIIQGETETKSRTAYLVMSLDSLYENLPVKDPNVLYEHLEAHALLNHVYHLWAIPEALPPERYKPAKIQFVGYAPIRNPDFDQNTCLHYSLI